MRKVLILNGSPRKKGNTSILCEYLSNQLSNKLHIEQLFLYDFAINPCMDCRACKEEELECILDDGMTEIYSKIDDADILIFGSPIYWFGPTAQTKLLVDRFRPYYVNKKLKGKVAALILPAGTGAADCDLTSEMFKRTFDALEIKYLGAVTSKSYDAGDSYDDKQALNSIIELSNKIHIS